MRNSGAYRYTLFNTLISLLDGDACGGDACDAVRLFICIPVTDSGFLSVSASVCCLFVCVLWKTVKAINRKAGIFNEICTQQRKDNFHMVFNDVATMI